MELRDYRDMYDKMSMSNEMDERIRNAVLNQQGGKGYNMKKHSYKKTAVAAVLCGLALAGGVSAYAATRNISLLSIFEKESSEVKNNAARLIDTEVAQKKVNKEQEDLATFEITEAVCDKNNVVVQIEIKAADNEKFLLVPAIPFCDPDLEYASSLNIRGAKINENMTIAEYAKSIGKKCLKVSAEVDCGDSRQAIDNYMKEDGTMVFTITFENVEKQKKLDYVCETAVGPINKGGKVRDKIKFTLTDKSNVKVLKYLPVSNGKIAGTNIVVDEVTYEKSDLSMMCNVKYHYTGKDKKWSYNEDGGVTFDMLDKNGEWVPFSQNSYGGKTEFDGNTAVQRDSLSLIDLPETITFAVHNVLVEDENGNKSYGTFDVKLAK